MASSGQAVFALSRAIQEGPLLDEETKKISRALAQVFLGENEQGWKLGLAGLLPSSDLLAKIKTQTIFQKNF